MSALDTWNTAFAYPSHGLVNELYIHNFNRFTSSVLFLSVTPLAYGAGSTLSSSQYGSDQLATIYTPSSLAATSQKLSLPTFANIPPSAHFSIGH